MFPLFKLTVFRSPLESIIKIPLIFEQLTFMLFFSATTTRFNIFLITGQTAGGGTTPTQDASDIKSEDVKPSMSVLSPYSDLRDGEEKKLKFGFPPSQAANYSVADCRALVKTLVCGVKTITWGCTSCKTDATPTVAGQPVQVFFQRI